MTLRRLSAHNFRNLLSVHIELSPQLNIFFGQNGSGKTSLLEAISTLSQGRSFRSRKYKTIINHDAAGFTVFGEVLGGHQNIVPIGVQRDRNGETLIKKAGAVCRSAAVLADALPIRVLNAHSFSLLEGAPEVRRQFLDWLVFHVEPKYHQAWKAYEKCLKHRNSLLRHDKIDPLQLAPWDREMAVLAEEMHGYRLKCFDLLCQTFNTVTESLSPLTGLSFKYHRGWDKSLSYAELLSQCQQRDMDLGYTRQGPHRADVKILIDGNQAIDVLSRGQQKVVVSALLIAQGMVFSEMTGRRCLYLIDDLPAELDVDFRNTLADWLTSMGCQVCVTGVDLEAIRSSWKGIETFETRVFHVEHGKVKQLENSDSGFSGIKTQ